MYKRYQGNTGKVTWVEDHHGRAPQPNPTRAERHSQPSGQGRGALPFWPLLPNSFGDLETEDILLLLIFYLLYRESGDTQWLIMLGAMFLS